ncbi:MAG: EAL domain-containing protein [Candidatus Omnitrophica bacterium]|nr:EAL domain-containing protein [Candidatus Omnitrophota bacterium]
MNQKNPQKIRILLIEDNPVDVDLIDAMLTQGMTQSYDFISKNTLDGALALLEKRPFDLIITDLNLPDGQGLDTFKRIHDHSPSIPIIVLTGIDDKSIAVQSVQYGAQDFIEKGELTGSLLVQSILYSIGRKRAEGQSGIYQKFAHIAGYGYCTTQEDGSVISMNNTLARMLDISENQTEPFGSILDFYSDDQKLQISNQLIPEVLEKGQWVGELVITSKKGVFIPSVQNVILIQDDRSNSTVIGWLIIDMTASQKAEEYIQKLSLAVEQSPGGILIIDLKGTIEYMNPKFEVISGYSRRELMGRDLRELLPVPDSQQQYNQMWECINAQRSWSGEMCNNKKDGSFYWENSTVTPIKSPNDVISHFLIVKEDISVRKEYEQQLLHQAFYDSLTGLPNRVLALDRIAQTLKRADRSMKPFAIMFIDLDGFKKVNDTLGHPAGDALLIQAARRLIGVVRKTDTVARLGGDEFVVVLPELLDDKYSTYIARRLLDAFAIPFKIEGQDIYVTASIGVSIFPDDGNDPDLLLKNSDVAMYKAKEEERNTFRYFKKEMNVKAMDRMNMEAALRHAIDNEGLFVVYQPIIDIHAHKIVSSEALIRWRHPTRGEISPVEFIPLAEDTGLIVPLGDWIFEEACRQLKEWHETLDRQLKISINISAQQFRKTLYLEEVLGVLDRTKLAPYNVQLEVTESLLIKSNPKVTTTLKAMNRIGLMLAIDDFGTGYSSLNYIQNFSFNTIKIDRSFITDVNTNERKDKKSALSVAILSMAHSLGLKVVAEGVETEDQLKFLKMHSCDLVQGYFFSKPLGANEFVEYYKKFGDPI